jgi:hypothetical protein
MIRVGGVHLCGAVLAACVGASAAFGGAAIDVPSGQTVTLADIIQNAPLDPEGVVRFRFIAPAIARANPRVSHRQATADMAHLCTTYALPKLAELDLSASQIVISLSDQPVIFGEFTPGATQFFEAYTPNGTTCEWDPF